MICQRRRHQYLTLSQERAFLQPFMARAARGEMVTAAEIKLAFEEETKQSVALSSIYRLLDRHGWRQRGAGATSAHSPKSKPASGNRVSVPEHREPSPPKSKPTSGNRVSVPGCREPSPSKGKFQGYRSRPHRAGVGDSGTADPTRQARRATPQYRDARSGQRDLVPGPYWRPMACLTA